VSYQLTILDVSTIEATCSITQQVLLILGLVSWEMVQVQEAVFVYFCLY
jgi:hypothetical protein